MGALLNQVSIVGRIAAAGLAIASQGQPLISNLSHAPSALHGVLPVWRPGRATRRSAMLLTGRLERMRAQPGFLLATDFSLAVVGGWKRPWQRMIISEPAADPERI